MGPIRPDERYKFFDSSPSGGGDYHWITTRRRERLDDIMSFADRETIVVGDVIQPALEWMVACEKNYESVRQSQTSFGLDPSLRRRPILHIETAREFDTELWLNNPTCRMPASVFVGEDVGDWHRYSLVHKKYVTLIKEFRDDCYLSFYLWSEEVCDYDYLKLPLCDLGGNVIGHLDWLLRPWVASMAYQNQFSFDLPCFEDFNHATFYRIRDLDVAEWFLNKLFDHGTWIDHIYTHYSLDDSPIPRPLIDITNVVGVSDDDE